MKYQIEVVRNDELPTGVRRVLIERSGDDPLMLIPIDEVSPLILWCEANCEPQTHEVAAGISSMLDRRG